MFLPKKNFLGYIKNAFLMIFKIRPDENPFSATPIFNHSSANFDPTELCHFAILRTGQKVVSLNLPKTVPIKNDSLTF